MEGSFRSILLWIVSVAVITGILFGLRSLLLAKSSPATDGLRGAVTSPSPPFGDPPRQWGVHMNAFVINDLDDTFDPVKVDATIAILKDLGVNTVMLPYEAGANNEPRDAVNDVMVEKLTKAGLTTVLYCCDGFSFGEENLYATAYAFAQRLGQKYRDRVDYYQFVNEISGTAIKPGHSGFSFEDYDLEKYNHIRELIRGFTDGLASVHPRAKRLVSAHWLGIAIIDQLIKDRVSFEIVAWHWFSDMGPDPLDIILKAERGVPAEFDGQHFNLPAHFTEQGKEFWITETNLPLGSFGDKEPEQAAYLAHMLEAVDASDEVSGFFYYRLTDGAENAGNSAWGLYQTKATPDGSTLEFDRPKEAYQIYKEFLQKQRQGLVLPFDPKPVTR